MANAEALPSTELSFEPIFVDLQQYSSVLEWIVDSTLKYYMYSWTQPDLVYLALGIGSCHTFCSTLDCDLHTLCTGS